MWKPCPYGVADSLKWPPHLATKFPDLNKDTGAALSEYFQWSKGNWAMADFLAQCSEAEMPEWLRNVCMALKATSHPLVPSAAAAAKA